MPPHVHRSDFPARESFMVDFRVPFAEFRVLFVEFKVLIVKFMLEFVEFVALPVLFNETVLFSLLLRSAAMQDEATMKRHNPIAVANIFLVITRSPGPYLNPTRYIKASRHFRLSDQVPNSVPMPV